MSQNCTWQSADVVNRDGGVAPDGRHSRVESLALQTAESHTQIAVVRRECQIALVHVQDAVDLQKNES